MRALAFGPEYQFTHYLGAYVSIFTIDNFLGIRDRAMLYNEAGRGAAVFTVPGNARAKAVLLFRSPRLEIDFRDREAQHAALAEQFAGMGWETARLLERMPEAYDFYFDEMSQILLPNWSTEGVALLGDAAFAPSPMSGQGTSLALIGAYLMAHELALSSDIQTALARWEQSIRWNVVQNQRLAIGGMKMLLPGSQLAILLRNHMVRQPPILARLGRGFGGRLERASRAITLPPDPTVSTASSTRP